MSSFTNSQTSQDEEDFKLALALTFDGDFKELRRGTGNSPVSSFVSPPAGVVPERSSSQKQKVCCIAKAIFSIAKKMLIRLCGQKSRETKQPSSFLN
jgi:hypothetical protein